MGEPVETTPTHGGYERRDVAVRPVAIAFVLLGVLILLSFVFMRALLVAYRARPSTEAPPLAAEYGRSEPPAPRLQTNPLDDLRRLRETEEQLLHGYGWVDRQGGTVRIPIERAMTLLAERGR